MAEGKLIPPTVDQFQPPKFMTLSFAFNPFDRLIRLEDRSKNTEEGVEMKNFGFTTLIASGLAAAVLGFAGPAQADFVTTPSLPHYSVDNHDNANTTNGFVDQPF
jgi:hypothetical protein